MDFVAMSPIVGNHVPTEAEWNQLTRNVRALGSRRQIEVLTRGAATLGYTNGFWTSLFSDPQNIAVIPRVSAQVLAILTVQFNADSMYGWTENDFALHLNGTTLTGNIVRQAYAHGNVGGTVTHTSTAVVMSLLTLPTTDGVNYLQGRYRTSTNVSHSFAIHSARLMVKEL
jgi:hypothetical protein